MNHVRWQRSRGGLLHPLGPALALARAGRWSYAVIGYCIGYVVRPQAGRTVQYVVSSELLLGGVLRSSRRPCRSPRGGGKKRGRKEEERTTSPWPPGAWGPNADTSPQKWTRCPFSGRSHASARRLAAGGRGRGPAAAAANGRHSLGADFPVPSRRRSVGWLSRCHARMLVDAIISSCAGHLWR